MVRWTSARSATFAYPTCAATRVEIPPAASEPHTKRPPCNDLLKAAVPSRHGASPPGNVHRRKGDWHRLALCSICQMGHGQGRWPSTDSAGEDGFGGRPTGAERTGTHGGANAAGAAGEALARAARDGRRRIPSLAQSFSDSSSASDVRKTAPAGANFLALAANGHHCWLRRRPHHLKATVRSHRRRHHGVEGQGGDPTSRRIERRQGLASGSQPRSFTSGTARGAPLAGRSQRVRAPTQCGEVGRQLGRRIQAD